MLPKLLFLTLAFIAVGTGSFFAVRELAIGGATLREQAGQVEPLERPALAEEPTPTPPGELPEFIKEQNRLAAEDAAKPKFEGVLNGIRFMTQESFQQDPIGCLGIPGLRAEYADPETARGTELDIVLTYPSSEVKPDRAWASTCAGELVVLEHEYLTSLGVTISRSRATPDRLVVINVPRERLVEGTIGGRPAVFVKPVNASDTFTIFIAEPFGRTTLVGGTTLEELIKIAEGLK